MTSDNSSPSRPEIITSQETKSADLGEERVLHTVQHELLSAGMRPDHANLVAERLLTVVTHHSGPLPSVKDFAGYENVCQGASRDILDMAKRQQQHDHWVGKASFFLEFAGLIAAVAIIGLMLLTAYYLAVQSQPWLAGLVLTGSVSGLVAIFWQKNDTSGPRPQEPEDRRPSPKQNRKRRK